MPSISLRGVTKRYRLYNRPQDRVKELLSFGRKSYGDDFLALNNVDLDVEPGTTLGILGRNGAGKSTLLKIVSGVLSPTEGEVDVNGRLALLQLGAGVNADFTGRENVMLNGMILGIEREEMLERFDEIEDFADLGDFMDRPVKTYSSGMRARLGFAVAINVQPDILILDETLSVGDAVFKQVGLQKMRDLRDKGTTILFVSHSMGMVKNFCSEAILLHKGEVLARGGTSETLDNYQALLSRSQRKGKANSDGNNESRPSEQGSEQTIEYDIDEDDEISEPTFKQDPGLDDAARASLRHGTGEACISSVEVLNGQGDPAEIVSAGSSLTVRVHLSYAEQVKGSNLSITLRNEAGLDIFTTSTKREKSPLRTRRQGEKVIVDFGFEVPLQPGSYSVTAAVTPQQEKNAYLDRVDVAAVFKILRPDEGGNIKGLVHLPAEVTIHSPASAEGNSSGGERQSQSA